VPDEQGDSYGKAAIIDALEDWLADERVVAFYLKVVADQSEFDMARIAALKILRWNPPSGEAHQRVGRLLAATLPIEPDVLVQQWAAIAAEYYVDVPELFATLAALVADQQVDLDVRHNCLAAIKRQRGSDQATAILQQLADDAELGISARRTLVDWDQKGP
jgi:hypothetical protein